MSEPMANIIAAVVVVILMILVVMLVAVITSVIFLYAYQIVIYIEPGLTICGVKPI